MKSRLTEYEVDVKKQINDLVGEFKNLVKEIKLDKKNATNKTKKEAK